MTAGVTPLAELFVAAINAHDVEQLLALMTSDHRFIDSLRVYADNEPLRERMRASTSISA